MNEQELRQLFKNRSDCYADTWQEEFDHMVEGDVIPAMTEDRFIEVLRETNLLPTSDKNVWDKLGDFPMSKE